MDHIDPQQYDQHAHEFEGLAQAASYNAFYERPATLDLIGDVAGKRVLDVACGPGWHANQLIARGAEVIGCDGSPKMVELARASVGQPDAFRVHECDDPFDWVPDQSIDLVLMALAYHYVNDHDGFLAEMHRVLRPDGAFVISTHHPMDDFRRLGGSYFDRERVTERWGNGWDVATWRMPLTELAAGFRRAGFLIERLVEPRPVLEMREADRRVFDKLETAPAFILFRLVKRSS